MSTNEQDHALVPKHWNRHCSSTGDRYVNSKRVLSPMHGLSIEFIQVPETVRDLWQLTTRYVEAAKIIIIPADCSTVGIKYRRNDPIIDVGRIVEFLQHQDGKIPKEEELEQGTHEEKNSAQVEIPSTKKHDIRGIDSNMGSNQGWSPRGLQLPKIDMRKFDGMDPITWIFQME